MRKLLLTAALCVAASGSEQTLKASIAEKEQVLSDLRLKATAAHNTRCSTLQSTPSKCSIPACGNVFDESTGFRCDTGFGDKGFSSKDNSVVRIPPDTDFTDAETRAFVYSSRQLDTAFSKALSDKKVSAWEMIGHTSGALRLYPGVPQSRTESTCSAYDARQRPWYVAASSGPKDLVIVIDVSGSMGKSLGLTGTQTRLSALQQAVGALLGSLTQNDYVAVVTFSNNAAVVGGSSSLQRATKEHIQSLITGVNALSASGQTNMGKGLTKAFQLLAAPEDTSGCTRIVQFLTDGVSSDHSIASEAERLVLKSVVDGQALLTGKKANVFTYSMSQTADTTIPRAIACAHDGVWMPINDGVDPLSAMSQYYRFLASGMKNDQARWTNPYEDAFGKGQMVSAALPVYDNSLLLPLLVGVVSIDVTIAELETHEVYANIISELISRGAQCPTLSLAECQLQHLRSPTGYTCPDQKSVTQCNTDNEIVELAKCSGSGNLNDGLCEALSPTTRVSQSGPQTLASVVPCGKSPFTATVTLSVILSGGSDFENRMKAATTKKSALDALAAEVKKRAGAHSAAAAVEIVDGAAKVTVTAKVLSYESAAAADSLAEKSRSVLRADTLLSSRLAAVAQEATTTSDSVSASAVTFTSAAGKSEPKSPESPSSKKGIIIGAAVGGTVLLLAVIGIVFYCRTRNQPVDDFKPATSANATTGAPAPAPALAVPVGNAGGAPPQYGHHVNAEPAAPAAYPPAPAYPPATHVQPQAAWAANPAPAAGYTYGSPAAGPGYPPAGAPAMV